MLGHALHRSPTSCRFRRPRLMRPTRACASRAGPTRRVTRAGATSSPMRDDTFENGAGFTDRGPRYTGFLMRVPVVPVAVVLLAAGCGQAVDASLDLADFVPGDLGVDDLGSCAIGDGGSCTLFPQCGCRVWPELRCRRYARRDWLSTGGQRTGLERLYERDVHRGQHLCRGERGLRAVVRKRFRLRRSVPPVRGGISRCPRLHAALRPRRSAKRRAAVHRVRTGGRMPTALR